MISTYLKDFIKIPRYSDTMMNSCVTDDLIICIPTSDQVTI